MNHMRKLAHLYHPIVWYKCKSLRIWFVIPFYHKIFIFAVLERWLIYDCETESRFVYLIFAVLIHKFNQSPVIEYCYSIFTPLSTCACDLHIPSKFHPNRTTPVQLWRHIDFSRWLPWHCNSYSGCVFSDGTRLIYRFQKQTALILEFKFRFTIWTHTSLWHAAHFNTTNLKVCRRVTNHAKVISIYRESSMASTILDL